MPARPAQTREIAPSTSSLPTPGETAPPEGAPAGGPAAVAQPPDAGVPAPARVAEILGAADLARTVDRIAHQILEHAGSGELVLLGIPTRGAILARRLAARLTAFAGRSCPHGIP